MLLAPDTSYLERPLTMPERMLPSLRLALVRMANPPLDGTIELHVAGGICARVKPHHALPHDFAWVPTPTGTLSPAVEAVLAEAAHHLRALHTYRLDCHLVIRVVAGVPQLPLEVEYVDAVGPTPRRAPRLAPAS